MTPLVLALLISSGTATTDMASSQTNAATVAKPVAASSTGIAAPMPPRVSAVPVSEGCLHHLRLGTNATVEIDFGGDLAAMPPMILARTGEVTLPRTPGRVVAWSVRTSARTTCTPRACSPCRRASRRPSGRSS